MPQTTSSNAKVVIITAIITVAGTVLTAFIGVIPQMRQGDRATIEKLSKETDDLKKQVEELGKPSEALYKVSGRVRSKSNAPVKDAVLYAASADDSVPLDDNGMFLFQNMSRKSYWVVLASQTGTIHRLLINPEDPATESEDLAISYSFLKE